MNSLTLDAIIEKILDLEEDYSETAKGLHKVWAPYSIANDILEQLKESTEEEQILPILSKLEEGFSNPMSFKSADGITTTTNMEVDAESQSHTSSKDFTVNNKIIEDGVMFYRNNRKIKKFWSSDTLRDAWKEYLSKIQNGGISALFLAVCVFIDQTEIYIEKLRDKLEKHKQIEEKSIKDKVSKRSSKASERNERKRKAGFYKEESSIEASEDDSRAKRSKRRKLNNESEFEEDSVEEESEEDFEDEGDEEDMEDEDSNWDTECYVRNLTIFVSKILLKIDSFKVKVYNFINPIKMTIRNKMTNISLNSIN